MRTLLALGLSVIVTINAHAANAQQFLLHGKMVATNIEGGCWYLDAGGKHYELTGDSSSVAATHLDGAYITVLVEPAKGAMSACMIGEVVKLVQVQEAERHPVDMMVTDLDISGRMRKTADGKWYVQTTKGSKYLITRPASRYRHTGAKYHRFSRVVSGPEREAFAGTIVGDARKPAPSK